MATFVYQARGKSGSVHDGELVASDRKQAMLDLRGKGLQPVTLEEQIVKKRRVTERSILPKDIILFTEELSELLNAGLPLEPALASMENREEAGVLKSVAGKLRAHVTDGTPFHVALPQVSDKFDQLYCSLVAAGEASGSLPSIIKLHADYLKEQAELKSKLIVAMVYPLSLVLACIGVSLIFIFYLLPQISGLLESVNDSGLPIGIVIAQGLGDFMRAYWPFLIAGGVIVILGIKIYFMPEKNKEKWDGWKIHLPFFGAVAKYSFYVQWLQTLSNLLSNGVPLVQALGLTHKTVQNRFFKMKLNEVTEKVKDGIRLTTSMKSSGLFPTSMVDLLAVSDQTGKLDESVKRAAKYYENQLSVTIKWFMTSFTMLVLLGMALLVAVLCYTMLQAIYGSIENMRR